AVDVVEADTRPAHDDQIGAGLQHLGRDLGGGPDDQGVGPGDDLEQLIGRQFELHVDVVAGVAHGGQAAFGELFGDENACHGGPDATDLRRYSAKSLAMRVTPSTRSSSPSAYDIRA